MHNKKLVVQAPSGLDAFSAPQQKRVFSRICNEGDFYG
jgi:hypothetical protein